MQIYNTLGRRLEPLETRDAGAVAMYVCGATVQSRPHLGHGRYAVVFDVLRRYLEWIGYDVTYVRNITDIDDKIIAAADERGVTTEVVAAEAAEAFAAAYDALGVAPPDVEPRATRHIPQMVELIERLIDSGHAYTANGDVYFSVRSFPAYGKLSGRNIDELRSGARVEPGEHKRDPLDFALWKASKPGEPAWDSPWGSGRPGWHIECSAMSQEYVGIGFDIHAGGNDLVFPHHENEIAQAEAAADGATFARYWMHNGMVNLGGEKMAKSTGHVIDLLDAVEKFQPLAVRLFYLRTHYRKPVDFTEEALADAEASLDRLWAFRRRVSGPVEDDPAQEYVDRFKAAMDDDLDVAGGLAVIFEVVKEGNRLLDAGDPAGPLVAAYDELTELLGLAEPEASLDDIAEQIVSAGRARGIEVAQPIAVLSELIARREEARANRDFGEADAIRDELGNAGIALEDTADGVRWHRR